MLEIILSMLKIFCVDYNLKVWCPIQTGLPVVLTLGTIVTKNI